jgi:hypothetical protein
MSDFTPPSGCLVESSYLFLQVPRHPVPDSINPLLVARPLRPLILASLYPEPVPCDSTLPATQHVQVAYEIVNLPTEDVAVIEKDVRERVIAFLLFNAHASLSQRRADRLRELTLAAANRVRVHRECQARAPVS